MSEAAQLIGRVYAVDGRGSRHRRATVLQAEACGGLSALMEFEMTERYQDDQVVGTVPLGPRSEIRITLSITEYGWQRLDIRQWWRPEGESDMQPSQKGINIPATKLQALIDALRGEKAAERPKRKTGKRKKTNRQWRRKAGREYGI